MNRLPHRGVNQPDSTPTRPMKEPARKEIPMPTDDGSMYVLIEGYTYEGAWVVGVFSSLELAREAMESEREPKDKNFDWIQIKKHPLDCLGEGEEIESKSSRWVYTGEWNDETDEPVWEDTDAN